jgi:hypothetical protein
VKDERSTSVVKARLGIVAKHVQPATIVKEAALRRIAFKLVDQGARSLVYPKSKRFDRAKLTTNCGQPLGAMRLT